MKRGPRRFQIKRKEPKIVRLTNKEWHTPMSKTWESLDKLFGVGYHPKFTPYGDLVKPS